MSKKRQIYFLLDFDSTFITEEGLEIFAEELLKHHPSKNKIIKKISSITNKAMTGEISFSESLTKRVAYLAGNKKQVVAVSKILKEKISPSILANKSFFKHHKEQIYIISGGFKEFIHPAIKQFGIRKDHVFANTFIYDQNNNIVGIDTKNVMSQDRGKVKVVKKLKLKGDLYIIGDGYTDYELKKLGLAKKFIAFTENISRHPVIKHADEIAPTFDEFLFVNKLPRSLSYPKNRITAISLGQFPEKVKKTFLNENYQCSEYKGVHLSEKLHKTSILYLGDPDKVSPEIFTHARRLLAVALPHRKSFEVPKSLHRKGIAVFYGEDCAKRIVDFINTGDTYKNIVLPQINLPKPQKTHRLLHIHKNMPGMLAQITKVISKHNGNIISQYLQTNEEIGYLITDIDKVYNNKLLQELKTIPYTIRFRVLY